MSLEECVNRRENVLKVYYEVNEEEEKQMEVRSPAFIEKDRITASPSRSTFPWRSLDVSSMRILRQSAAHWRCHASRPTASKWLAKMLAGTSPSEIWDAQASDIGAFDVAAAFLGIPGDGNAVKPLVAARECPCLKWICMFVIAGPKSMSGCQRTKPAAKVALTYGDNSLLVLETTPAFRVYPFGDANPVTAFMDMSGTQQTRGQNLSLKGASRAALTSNCRLQRGGSHWFSEPYHCLVCARHWLLILWRPSWARQARTQDTERTEAQPRRLPCFQIVAFKIIRYDLPNGTSTL